MMQQFDVVIERDSEGFYSVSPAIAWMSHPSAIFG